MTAPRNPTAMQRLALDALAGAPGGTLTRREMFDAAGTTTRARPAIRRRMEEAGWIEDGPYDGIPRHTITEAGRNALAEWQRRTNEARRVAARRARTPEQPEAAAP